jgi:hypothetical protein
MHNGVLEHGTIPVPRTVKGRDLFRRRQLGVHEYAEVMVMLQNPAPI